VASKDEMANHKLGAKKASAQWSIDLARTFGRLAEHERQAYELSFSGSSLGTRHCFFLPRPEGHSGVHLGLVLLRANSLFAKVNVLAPAAAG